MIPPFVALKKPMVFPQAIFSLLLLRIGILPTMNSLNHLTGTSKSTEARIFSYLFLFFLLKFYLRSLMKILSSCPCIQLERHCLLLLISLKTFRGIKGILNLRQCLLKKSFTCLLLKFFNVSNVYPNVRQNLSSNLPR